MIYIFLFILFCILFIFFKYIYYISKCLEVLAATKDISDLGTFDYYIIKANTYAKFNFQKNLLIDIKTLYINLYLLLKKN